MKCAIGPCNAPRASGSPYCELHGPPPAAEFRTIATVRLSERHQLRGPTTNFNATVDGVQPMPQPAMLRIIQFVPVDRGTDVATQHGEVILEYCDENGHDMNDTDHASVEEAMESARVQYNVSLDEWSI